MIINHHEIPILKPCVALIFGILISDYIPEWLRVSSILVYLTLLLFAWILVSKKKTTQHSKSVFVFFLLCCFGISSVQERSPELKSFPYDVQAEAFTVRIDKLLPHDKHKKCLVSILSVQSADSSFVQSVGKILVYFDNAALDSSIYEGAEYYIAGKLSTLKPPTNPHSFDYAAYLHNDGIYHQVFVKNNGWQFLRTNSKSRLHTWIKKIQIHAKSILATHFPNSSNLALVNAMVLGDRADLDNSQKESFINTGAIHVLAVSGLHVGILCLFLSAILKLLQRIFPIPNILIGLVIILCIWIFALITGASAAVCRAAMMFSLFYLSRDILHRYVSVYNVIFASAFILLLINPLQIYKVGFQFSYLAVISIVFFYPYVNLWINSKYKFINYFWSSIALGISAQVLVFPISIFYFNKFASSFFITSMFVVQIAMVILIACLIVILLESINFGFINLHFISPITNWVLEVFQNLINWVQKLPFSYIDEIWIDKTQLVLMYLIIASLMLLIKQKSIKYFLVILSFSALLIFYSYDVNQTHLVQHRAFIYDDKYGCVDVFLGTNCLHLGSQTTAGDAFVYGRNRMAHKIRSSTAIDTSTTHDAFEFKNEIMRLGNQFLAFANVETFTEVHAASEIDYLIVNADHSDLSEIAVEKIINTEIILDGSLKPWTRSDLILYCQENNLSYFDVKKNGAKLIEF